MTEALTDRLARLPEISLKTGSHSPDSTFCAMELVAWLANEPWSDAPACACPVISAFVRSWNDAIRSDVDRDQLLKPIIPLLLDSKQSAAVELARSYLAVDWLARVQAPAWLDLTVALHPHAAILRALAPPGTPPGPPLGPPIRPNS